ncbi:MAG: hypothetical protein LBM77_12400 [Spirochaetaceae bacterium]|jgi:hypothetical protein|nr:hypothetical protein [Spirochaetaceae bacterium]
MMKKFFTITVTLLLAASLSGALFADNIIPSTRAMGMGGFHVSGQDGIWTLMTNPANITGLEQFDIATVGFSVGNVLTFQDAIKNFSLKDPTKMLFSLLSSKRAKNYSFNLTGPLALGMIKNGFGWGVFDDANTFIGIKNNMVKFSAQANLQGRFAYGMNIVDTSVFSLDAGAGAKVLFGFNMNATTNMTTLVGLISDTKDMLGKMGVTTVPLSMSIGADAGLTGHLKFLPLLNDDLAFSIVAEDVIGMNTNIVDLAKSMGLSGSGYSNKATLAVPKINVGVSYNLTLFGFLGLGAYVDYHDAALQLFTEKAKRYLLNDGLLNLSMGLEAKLFDMVSVRTGVYDWAPSVGLGLAVKGFTIDLAAYTKEMGSYPGEFSVPMIDVGLCFRL